MDTARNGLWLAACAAFLLGVLFSPISLVAQNNFLRGDANCDGCVNALDAWDLLGKLFEQEPLPCDCEAAQDANFDDTVNVTDAVYVLGYIFLAGPAPGAPFPVCGPAPAGTLLPCVGYPPCLLFKRGDANQDGCVSEADANLILAYIAEPANPIACMKAADANDDGTVDVSDAILILAYCKTGGPPPSAPGPEHCGGDPTPDALTCGSYPQTACSSGCRNQLPSDCNQDGTLDISDPICMLGFLFMGTPDKLPCGEGEGEHPSNMMLLDHNGDNKFDMSDAIGLLQFLFIDGKPPSRGRDCIYIDRCPQNPKCPPFTP